MNKCVRLAEFIAIAVVTLSITKTQAQTQTNIFPLSANVGIGTTNPNTKLEISGGPVLTDGNDVLYSNIFWTGSGWQYTESNLPAFAIRNTEISDTFEIRAFPHGIAGQSPTSFVDAIVINGATGSVGIGTLNPGLNGELLSIYSPNIYSVRAQGASGNAVLLGSQAGSKAGWVQGSDSGGRTADLTFNPVGGNVGIGTPSPLRKLHISGDVQIDGNLYFGSSPQAQGAAYAGVPCGGDYAESVDVTGDRSKYEPGDVLVIDPNISGKFLRSAEAYSTSVTGIYSTKPGTLGRRQTAPRSDAEVPMAMVGIVPTKVTAENGPIHRGDLLVTSSRIGYAMKGTDRSRMLGAVIGKALDTLETGNGMIEVVVTLQ